MNQTEITTRITEQRKADLLWHLKYWVPKGQEPSEAGYRVADLLDIALGGLHHLDRNAASKADWTDPHFVALNWRYPNLATFDGEVLTRLVFLAHDLCIRIEIDAAKARVPRLYFHPRHGRTGGFSARHPTLESQIESWRSNHPITF